MSRQLASRRFTTHTIPVHPKTHKGEQLKLVVNHYPSTTTAPHTVVCLFAHANGYTKESWIPVIERLKDAWKNRSDSALDIWTYDSRNSGDSAVVNAEWLDEKALWQDYGRDIQQMISHFGLEPSATSSLFGIGHSMGATSLLVAGISQPHSFTALIAIDPVLAKETVKQDPPIAALALKRRDRWPSRVEAKESFLKRPYYQRWDPRQVDIYAEFGLLESPNGSANFAYDRETYYLAYENAHRLQCPVLAIAGEESNVFPKHIFDAFIQHLPYGKGVRLPKTSHLVLHEKPDNTATEIIRYLKQTLDGPQSRM